MGISYLLWFLDSLQNPLQSFRKFAVDWDEFSKYFGSQLRSWSCWFLITKELFSALASKAAWLKAFSIQDLCEGMRHNPASGMWGWTLHFELEMWVSPLHVEFGTRMWPRRSVFASRVWPQLFDLRHGSGFCAFLAKSLRLVFGASALSLDSHLLSWWACKCA